MRDDYKFFMPDQKVQFLSTLKDSKNGWRDYFMFSLMLVTGLRISEALGLNVGDIFKDGAAVKSFELVGKGGKTRLVHVNKAVRERVAGYLKAKRKNGEETDESSPLFMSRHHKRISVRAVQHSFNNWVDLSKLEGKYSPHSLRHTAGTEMLKKHGNIRVVQSFLGHSNVRTTQRYTGVTKEDVMEAAELLTV